MEPVALNDLHIAKPCLESWDEMEGDDRVRHCRGCGQNVYNLSALSHSEALKLLRASEGVPCVRLYRRSDGSVLTRDCAVGAREQRTNLVRLGLRFGLLAGLLAATA